MQKLDATAPEKTISESRLYGQFERAKAIEARLKPLFNTLSNKGEIDRIRNENVGDLSLHLEAIKKEFDLPSEFDDDGLDRISKKAVTIRLALVNIYRQMAERIVTRVAPALSAFAELEANMHLSPEELTPFVDRAHAAATSVDVLYNLLSETGRKINSLSERIFDDYARTETHMSSDELDKKVGALSEEIFNYDQAVNNQRGRALGTGGLWFFAKVRALKQELTEAKTELGRLQQVREKIAEDRAANSSLYPQEFYDHRDEISLERLGVLLEKKAAEEIAEIRETPPGEDGPSLNPTAEEHAVVARLLSHDSGKSGEADKKLDVQIDKTIRMMRLLGKWAPHLPAQRVMNSCASVLRSRNEMQYEPTLFRQHAIEGGAIREIAPALRLGGFFANGEGGWEFSASLWRAVRESGVVAEHDCQLAEQALAVAAFDVISSGATKKEGLLADEQYKNARWILETFRIPGMTTLVVAAEGAAASRSSFRPLLGSITEREVEAVADEYGQEARAAIIYLKENASKIFTSQGLQVENPEYRDFLVQLRQDPAFLALIKSRLIESSEQLSGAHELLILDEEPTDPEEEKRVGLTDAEGNYVENRWSMVRRGDSFPFPPGTLIKRDSPEWASLMDYLALRKLENLAIDTQPWSPERSRIEFGDDERSSKVPARIALPFWEKYGLSTETGIETQIQNPRYEKFNSSLTTLQVCALQKYPQMAEILAASLGHATDLPESVLAFYENRLREALHMEGVAPEKQKLQWQQSAKIYGEFFKSRVNEGDLRAFGGLRKTFDTQSSEGLSVYVKLAHKAAERYRVLHGLALYEPLPADWFPLAGELRQICAEEAARPGLSSEKLFVLLDLANTLGGEQPLALKKALQEQGEVEGEKYSAGNIKTLMNSVLLFGDETAEKLIYTSLSRLSGASEAAYIFQPFIEAILRADKDRNTLKSQQMVDTKALIERVFENAVSGGPAARQASRLMEILCPVLREHMWDYSKVDLASFLDRMTKSGDPVVRAYAVGVFESVFLGKKIPTNLIDLSALEEIIMFDKQFCTNQAFWGTIEHKVVEGGPEAVSTVLDQLVSLKQKGTLPKEAASFKDTLIYWALSGRIPESHSAQLYELVGDENEFKTAMSGVDNLISQFPEKVTEKNWSTLLAMFLCRDYADANMGQAKRKRIMEMFDDKVNVEAVFTHMKARWNAFLAGEGEVLPADLAVVARAVQVGDPEHLKFIGALGLFASQMNEAMFRKTTAGITKEELRDGIRVLERQFTKGRWTDVDRSDFYAMSAEFLAQAPSLYTDLLNIVSQCKPAEFRRFVDEVFPIYRVQLTLARKNFADPRIRPRDAVLIRRRMLELAKDLSTESTDNQKERTEAIGRARQAALDDMEENFTQRLGIVGVSESMNEQQIRSVQNVLRYLGNMAKGDAMPEKEQAACFYLSLLLSGKWGAFRAGEAINPALFVSPDRVPLVQQYLDRRTELDAIRPEIVGLSQDRLGTFGAALQQEISNQVLAGIETVDERLMNAMGGVRALADPDAYNEVKDRNLLELAAEFGGGLGVVLRKTYQEVTGKKGDSWTPEERKVQERFAAIFGVTEWSAEKVKEIQDRLKPITLVTNTIDAFEKDDIEGEINQLRKLLIPPAVVVDIFGRLGEAFKPTSGALALSQDLSYLQKIVVQNGEKISADERQAVAQYLEGIRSQITKLEDVYSRIRDYTIKIRQSIHPGDNATLKDRLESLERAMAPKEQRLLQTTMTNDLNTIIENMRQCLGCQTPEINNDTNISFGDRNKFYLVTTPAEGGRSISDEIVFFEPITLADGSSQMSFVLDQLYETKTPDVLQNHVMTVLKKARMLKREFPDARLSVLVTDQALGGVLSPELFLKNLESQSDKVTAMYVDDVTVDVAETAVGDHYVEFGEGRGARQAGNRSTKGVLISI